MDSKVSIVLPTYNGSKYLKQAIESCLGQTHKNIELIIVNDCSTDNTRDIIASFDDNRIIYLENKENLGIANALNKGFGQVTGQYLTWTSDDNYYHENAIEAMLNNIHDADFVYAGYKILDGDNNLIKEIPARPLWKMDFKNIIGACFLYKREVYEKTGEFKKELFLAEDYEYWLRVRQNFRIKPIDQILYSYRLHKNSLSGKNKKQGRVAKAAYAASKPYVSLLGKIYQYFKMIYYSV